MNLILVNLYPLYDVMIISNLPSILVNMIYLITLYISNCIGMLIIPIK